MLSVISARRGLVVLIAVGSSALAAGCGSSSQLDNVERGGGPSTAASTSSSAGGAQPTVLAAASLTKVFPEIDPNAKYTFGGSGALETDIEQGAPADVFAAASPKQPAALYAKGLVDKPVQFATNTLVLIVPKSNPAHITSVTDITKPGVKLVICNATVPCGDYARTAFTNLGITTAAMKNVVSQTTDVTQTVAEVATRSGGRRVCLHHRRQGSERQGHRDSPSGEREAAGRGFHSSREIGQEPDRGQRVRRSDPLPRRSGEAERRWVRQAVSSAAAISRSSQGDRTRAWLPALGRAAVAIGATLVVAVVLAFLLLPIVALVTYQPVHDLVSGFGTSVATDAIVVSLKTNTIAFAVMIVLGTPFAYIVARSRFRGRSAVITLVELPLVMPPAVAGLGLLVAFGRFGLLGHTLSVLGIDLAFTQAAVVIAILFVASPFYLRGAIAAFESVDPTLLDVAATLGRGTGSEDAPDRDSGRGRRARGRGRGRVRARDRRVRRHDPVRGQPPRQHADAAARCLFAV